MSAYGPWLWRFVLMALLSATAGRAWAPGGFVTIAGTASLVALLYGLVMLPVMLRAPIGSTKAATGTAWQPSMSSARRGESRLTAEGVSAASA